MSSACVCHVKEDMCLYCKYKLILLSGKNSKYKGVIKK
jgi:hypothetical protein